jgi:TetR/AcrR family transcriptional regulator, mexCD-oprJ operon repressor
VTAHSTHAAPGSRPRRTDAQRSIDRIIEAAIGCLSANADASMADIARRAKVVRATIYAHFPTRESLIDAVTHHAIADTTRVIVSAEPDRGEPVPALARVISATWRKLGRYHALVAINSALPHEELHHRHGSVLAELQPLIERGQKAGVFRPEVPAAWHLATLLALVHSASSELSAGRISEDDVEDALLASVLGAVTATDSPRHEDDA